MPESSTSRIAFFANVSAAAQDGQRHHWPVPFGRSRSMPQIQVPIDFPLFRAQTGAPIAHAQPISSGTSCSPISG